ncbi:MAG: hypothetical protein QW328_07240 [Nitrososphaerota archaeon]
MPRGFTYKTKMWINVLMSLEGLATAMGLARRYKIPPATAHYLVGLSKSWGIIEARKIGGILYIAPRGKFDQYAAEWGRWFYELAVKLLNGCRSQCCRVPIQELYRHFRADIDARMVKELGLMRPHGVTAFISYTVRAYREDAVETISRPLIKVCRGGGLESNKSTAGL